MNPSDAAPLRKGLPATASYKSFGFLETTRKDVDRIAPRSKFLFRRLFVLFLVFLGVIGCSSVDFVDGTRQGRACLVLLA